MSGFPIKSILVNYNNQTADCPKSSCPDFQGLSGGAIAGIVVGSVVGLIIFGIIVYCLAKKCV